MAPNTLVTSTLNFFSVPDYRVGVAYGVDYTTLGVNDITVVDTPGQAGVRYTLPALGVIAPGEFCKS